MLPWVDVSYRNRCCLLADTHMKSDRSLEGDDNMKGREGSNER